MLTQQAETETYRIVPKQIYLRWLWLALLLLSTIIFPFLAATVGNVYPDLSIAPIVFSAAAFLWIPLLANCWRQTIVVTFNEHRFVVKKFLQTPTPFGYNTIVAHNERRELDREGAYLVLTVYLQHDFFILKSNDFADYLYLRECLCQYGQPVPYQKVMTVTERNRLRWLIGAAALSILATIAFGYLAHNPVKNQPAPLVRVADSVDRVWLSTAKGIVKGVNFRLRRWPDFTFYASRRYYDVPIQPLQRAILLNQPITLQIRQSDFRKKLTATEPLTTGDKFVDFRYISVYGIDQGNMIHIQSATPAFEPTRTNPLQRTIFLSFLLLICWTGWVYVDRHTLIPAD